MSEEMIDNLHNADGTQSEEQKNEPTTHEAVLEEIVNSNAEESEDETLQERHDIVKKDYESLSMEALVTELETLVSGEKIMAIKDHVEEIRKAFMAKYSHMMEEKREEYESHAEENKEPFHYHFPLKDKFDYIFDSFRTKRNQYFNQLQNNLKSNLAKRLSIIEALKQLIDGTDTSLNDMFKKMNEIKENWRNAGPIPRDKYNIVWNNYHFHLERFYDLVHLDKEARDSDFKNNLEQKQQIIQKAKELLQETDILKAFRELQLLHRVWKEEIGPVDRVHREKIWNEFSDITKQMHERRESIYIHQKEIETANLEAKNIIIEQINALSNEEVSAHNGWQGQIKKMEALRESFFKAGRVPAELTEETWQKFKNAVRNFNHKKNSFYKEIKSDQQSNLSKKQALVERAKSLQASEDFEATTPIMKQIQEEWKHIGHVPRKFSDQLWQEFKNACNAYFDRLHQLKQEENKEGLEVFEKKKAFLDELKDFELTGDHKTDLEHIKKHIEHWKSLGKVPVNRRHIEGKFNKVLDTLFEKLSMSKKDTEMMKFSNKLEQLANNEDERAIENEILFIKRKVDEVQSEIFQLENNIQFISNAKKDNPLVKEVQKSIERHREELKLWQEKLKKLRSI